MFNLFIAHSILFCIYLVCHFYWIKKIRNYTPLYYNGNLIDKLKEIAKEEGLLQHIEIIKKDYAIYDREKRQVIFPSQNEKFYYYFELFSGIHELIHAKRHMSKDFVWIMRTIFNGYIKPLNSAIIITIVIGVLLFGSSVPVGLLTVLLIIHYIICCVVVLDEMQTNKETEKWLRKYQFLSEDNKQRYQALSKWSNFSYILGFPIMIVF